MKTVIRSDQSVFSFAGEVMKVEMGNDQMMAVRRRSAIVLCVKMKRMRRNTSQTPLMRIFFLSSPLTEASLQSH